MVKALLIGFIVGSVANLVALVAAPYFLGRLVDLSFFPAIFTALAFLAYGSLSLARWGRGRRRADAASRRRNAKRLAIATAVAFVVPLVVFATLSPKRSWQVDPVVLIYCVDGGTWNILDPMLEAGELPNLKRLIDEGSSGVLRSTDPSFSPVVWTTIASGVPPEKHGITSFYSTQDHLRAPRFWEVLAGADRSIGLFRWLMTWPPREVEGFWVPGILARDARCHPSSVSFLNQLRLDRKTRRSMGPVAAVRYGMKFLRSGLRLDTCLDILGDFVRASRDPILVHAANRRAEIRLNMDVYEHLLRAWRPECTSFYDNGTDVLGHYDWKYMEPERFADVSAADAAKYGGIIQDFYVLVDEMLGDLLAHVDRATRVLVLSDHGQKADDEADPDKLYPKIEEILRVFGMDGNYYGIVLGSRTYVESVKGDPALRREAIASAAKQLEAVSVAETGLPLFDVEVVDEQRIVLRVRRGVAPAHSAGLEEGTVRIDDLVYTRPGYSGTHQPDGIFIARGPGIRSAAVIDTATLVDVAPTVLYLMDEPISRELTGSVIWSAITDPLRADMPVRWVESYGALLPEPTDLEVDEATMKTLRSLGYIR